MNPAWRVRDSNDIQAEVTTRLTFLDEFCLELLNAFTHTGDLEALWFLQDHCFDLNSNLNNEVISYKGAF